MTRMRGNPSIRSKLLALLLVPVVGAAVLAAAGATAAAGGGRRADRERRALAFASVATAVTHELQEERAATAAFLAAGKRRGAPGLRSARGRVDRAAAAFRAGAAALDLGRPRPQELQGALAAATGQLDRLPVWRRDTDRRPVSPGRAVAGYTQMVGALLGVERELAGVLETPASANGMALALAVAEAKEATGRERGLLATIRPDAGLEGGTLGRVAASAAVAGHELTRLHAAAGEGWPAIEDALAAAPGSQTARRLELAVVDATPAPSQPAARSQGPAQGQGGTPVGAAGPAQGQGSTAAGAVGPAQGQGSTAAGAAGPAQGQGSTAAGAAGPAQGQGLAAGAVGTGDAGVASPAELAAWRAALSARAGALRRVEQRLAADLAAAAGATAGAQTRRRNRLLLLAVAAAAALVGGIGLLLRVRGVPPPASLAAGQTLLGLARRGQGLLDRQLQLIDELERDERDPDRLEGFFRLDHLATRLRRNAETLLALAGTEPARRWERPVPVAGLLRAAIAEVEEYPRVELLAFNQAEVAGAAGFDLVHLLAELVDNAVAFSPPTAAVTVAGRADRGGYLVEVTDRGLGMPEEELAWANQRLEGRSVGPAGPERVGLVVVARLAGRHGICVRLDRSPAGGVAATVRLPARLLTGVPAVPPRGAQPEPEEGGPVPAGRAGQGEARA
jgi:signal transduction histidine kinase